MLMLSWSVADAPWLANGAIWIFCQSFPMFLSITPLLAVDVPEPNTVVEFQAV